MHQKEYADPVIGSVKLVKSPVSRRISIRVHPADGVRVIIPRSLSYDEGLRFFMLKRDWIISTVARQRMKIAEAEDSGKAVPLLRDGSVVNTLLSEIIFARGADTAFLRVHQHTETVEDVKSTGRIFLSLSRPVFRKTLTYPGSLPDEGTPELDAVLRKVLVEVMRSEAKLVLPKRLAFFASRYGFRYGKVTVKHNSSNWGSCSGKGNINLNLNLVRLPEPLCDYVLLHELAHLRFRDHGKRFHALLEKLCADDMARLAAGGDPYLDGLAGRIERSRAEFPVSRTMELEMKSYRII